MDHREASRDLRREESGTYGIDEKIHDSAHVENIKGQDIGAISGLSLEEQKKIIIFEIPSNLVLPKAGPANWLSFLGVGFGAVLIGMGFTKSWGIFIIEGAITVVVCAIGWFIIIDFPTQAGKFLKPAEQEFIIARINQDRGDAEEDKIDGAKILHHLKDWRLYFWAFNLMASTLPGYAYSYFLPIILRNGMGFSSTQAQLLSAPPYVLAAIMAYISGWLGDRYKMRGPIIAVHQALTAVGMLITVYGKANGARYFGAFLGIGFLQFCVPGVLTFQANNITSHSKRAVASATCLIGGGVGGIIASTAFMAKESPHYTTGIWATFAISMVSILMIIIMDIHLWRCNKAAKAGHRQNEDSEDALNTPNIYRETLEASMETMFIF
ncbi:putative transporter [Colletotrichum sp. SAR 10_98]|nr:putative transporter [Colletotrichum sp. SAR 10_98]